MAMQSSPIKTTWAERHGFVAALVSVLVILLLFLAGCDDRVPTSPKPAPETSATDLTAQLSPTWDSSARAVYLTAAEGGLEGHVAVSIRVDNVPTHRQLFFDLVYPNEIVAYSHFEQTHQASFNSFGTPYGSVDYVRGVVTPLEHSATLVTVYFDLLTEGTGTFEFVGYGTQEPGTGRDKRWGHLDWFGASVTVAPAPRN